jgi:hypothetical protein
MLKQICTVALLCVGSYANAGVVTQNFTIPLTSTDFTQEIEYNLFDTQGGTRTLESVEITLLAEASAVAEAENRSTSSGSSVTATVSAIIALIDLAGDTIVSAAPYETASKILGVFDGQIDFAGTSGAQFVGLDSSQTDSRFSMDIATLLAYTGTGTTTSTIDFKADALSSVTGGGNLLSGITTIAGGSVSIEYTFSDSVEVSAPAHLALLGMGLLAFGGLRKFKA